jgi:hypothetical protein
MDTNLILGLRNTLTLCILLTVITLVPYPLFCIQRAFLRMGMEILTWRHTMEGMLRKRPAQFLEIDMAKFDALERERT